MKWASTSLPTPLSPVINRRESVGATSTASLSRSRMARLVPSTTELRTGDPRFGYSDIRKRRGGAPVIVHILGGVNLFSPQRCFEGLRRAPVSLSNQHVTNG